MSWSPNPPGRGRDRHHSFCGNALVGNVGTTMVRGTHLRRCQGPSTPDRQRVCAACTRPRRNRRRDPTGRNGAHRRAHEIIAVANLDGDSVARPRQAHSATRSATWLRQGQSRQPLGTRQDGEPAAVGDGSGPGGEVRPERRGAIRPSEALRRVGGGDRRLSTFISGGGTNRIRPSSPIGSRRTPPTPCPAIRAPRPGTARSSPPQTGRATAPAGQSGTDQRELVAPETTQDVLRRRPSGTNGDLAQQFVADVVSVPVVDRLEPVEVDEVHPHRPCRLGRMRVVPRGT